MLPPRPAGAVFRIRVDGRILGIAFNDRREAERAAQGHVAPGRRVELIDSVTGELVVDVSSLNVPFAWDTPGAGWGQGSWSSETPQPTDVGETGAPPFGFAESGDASGLGQSAFASGPDSPDVPEVPPQGAGPHFELSKDGVIDFAPPEALDREGNNVERLRRLHPPLRDLARQLVQSLARGNAPHARIAARIEAYHSQIDQDLGAVDFNRLYIEGLRLANSDNAATAEIARGELPPLSEADREVLDTLLQLHGTFILASAVGAELLAAERSYQRGPTDEREYRAVAIDFATSLQNQPAIIAPDAAAFVLGAAEQIGQGEHVERSGVVATSTLQNVTIVLVAAAALAGLSGYAAVVGGPGGAAAATAALLLGDGLRKSKPFATIIAPIIARLDHAANIDFTKYRSFLLSVGQKARRLIRWDKQFRWLGSALDWLSAHKDDTAALDRVLLHRDELAKLLLDEARQTSAGADLELVKVSGPFKSSRWDIESWGFSAAAQKDPSIAIECGNELRRIADRLREKFGLLPDNAQLSDKKSEAGETFLQRWQQERDVITNVFGPIASVSPHNEYKSDDYEAISIPVPSEEFGDETSVGYDFVRDHSRRGEPISSRWWQEFVEAAATKSENLFLVLSERPIGFELEASGSPDPRIGIKKIESFSAKLNRVVVFIDLSGLDRSSYEPTLGIARQLLIDLATN